MQYVTAKIHEIFKYLFELFLCTLNGFPDTSHELSPMETYLIFCL